jgi:hypothetical protein
MSGIVTPVAVNNAAQAHPIASTDHHDHQATDSPSLQSLASVAAIGAGIAWIVWAAINARTHGGLDVGAAAVGEPLARLGALLMVSWNLLLLPAAVAFDAHMRKRSSAVANLVSLAGVTALLFWAFGGATHTITPTLEVSYLALSALWWGGIGAHFRRQRPAFGIFTLVLAGFALWDAILTAFEPVPWGLYLTAAPKLPLAIVWDFWVAWVLAMRGRINLS